MVDLIIVLISLIIGITIGWVLKDKSQPANSAELQSEIKKLTDEKARAEAKLEQMEEIKNGMETVFKSLASDIARENRKDFLNLAGEKFKDISKQADENLTKKKELIDQNLGEMIRDSGRQLPRMCVSTGSRKYPTPFVAIPSRIDVFSQIETKSKLR